MLTFQEIQAAIKTCYDQYLDTMWYWDSALLSDKKQRHEALVTTFEAIEEKIKSYAESDPVGARLLQSYFNLIFSSGTDFSRKLNSLSGETAGDAVKVAAMRSDYVTKAKEPLPDVNGIERLRFFETDLLNDLEKKIIAIERIKDNGSFVTLFGLMGSPDRENLEGYQRQLEDIKRQLMNSVSTPWRSEDQISAEALASYYNSNSFKSLIRLMARADHFFSDQIAPAIQRQNTPNLLKLRAQDSRSSTIDDFRQAINHDNILSIDTLCQGLSEIGHEALSQVLRAENDYHQGLNDGLKIFRDVRANPEAFARGILADLDPDLELLAGKSDAFYSGYYTAALVHAAPDLFDISSDGKITYKSPDREIISLLDRALGLNATNNLVHPKNFDIEAILQLQERFPQAHIWQLLKTTIPVSVTRSMASKLDDYHQLATIVNTPGRKDNQSAFPMSSKINEGLNTRKKLTRPLIDRIMYLSQKGIQEELLSYEEFNELFGGKLNELINRTHATSKIDPADVRSKLFQELIAKANLVYTKINRREAAAQISYQAAIEAAFADLETTKPEILQVLAGNLHQGIKAADYTPPLREAMLPREEREVTSDLPAEEPPLSPEETLLKLQADGLQCLELNQKIHLAIGICYGQSSVLPNTKKTLLTVMEQIKTGFDNIHDPILKQKMQEIILTAFGPDISSDNAFLRKIKQQHSVEELMQYHVYLQHFKQPIPPAPALDVDTPKLYIDQVLILEDIFLDKIHALNVAKKRDIIRNLEEFKTLSPISGVFKHVFTREEPFIDNLITFVNSKNLADFLSQLSIEKHIGLIENLKSYAAVDGLQQGIRNQVNILNERLGAMSAQSIIGPSRFTPAGLLITLNEIGDVNLSYKIGAINALEKGMNVSDTDVAAHLQALMASREPAAKGAAYVAILKDIAEGKLQILKVGDALTQARFFAGRMAIMMQDGRIRFTAAEKAEIVQNVKSGTAGAAFKGMQSIFGTKTKELSLAKYFALESPKEALDGEIRERYLGDFSQDLGLFTSQHATLDYPNFPTMSTSSASAIDLSRAETQQSMMEEMEEAIIEVAPPKLGYLGGEKIPGYLFDAEGNVVTNEEGTPRLVEGFEFDVENELPKLKEDWEYNEATGQFQLKIVEPDFPPPPPPILERVGYQNGMPIEGFQFNPENGDVLTDETGAPILARGFELTPENPLPQLMKGWRYDSATGNAAQIRGYEFDQATGKALSNEDGSLKLRPGWRQNDAGNLIPPPPPVIKELGKQPPPPPPPPPSADMTTAGAGNPERRGSYLAQMGVLGGIRAGVTLKKPKVVNEADSFVEKMRSKMDLDKSTRGLDDQALIVELTTKLTSEKNPHARLSLQIKRVILEGGELQPLKEAWLEAYQKIQLMIGSRHPLSKEFGELSLLLLEDKSHDEPHIRRRLAIIGDDSSSSDSENEDEWGNEPPAKP